MMAQALPEIELWFYGLSIATLVIGMCVGAFRAAVAWGKARGTWDDVHRLTEELDRKLGNHLTQDDRRFAEHDARLDRLERNR